MKELTSLEREAHKYRQSGKKFREIARLMNRKPEQIRMWCAKARRKLGLPPNISKHRKTHCGVPVNKNNQ